jgi:hypothetical protein
MVNIIAGVAIYGSIISSIALTWNIISYLIDKPKIVLKYHTGFMDLSGVGADIRHVFSMVFSNPTKHRIVVSSAGILFKNNQNLHFIGGNELLPDGFPKVLLQGDNHSIHRDIDVIKKTIDKQGAPLYIWVRDATGKTYKGSVKKMVGNVNAMYQTKHNNDENKKFQ